ncbi:MAG: DUF1311 domain-containing protein [Lachnospiraceae bacterium]|nr:DUF1311 domain-containing protein [Lachnospiraceae bacterium]
MKKNVKKVKVLSILLVTALVSALVIGCGSKSEDDSKKTNSESQMNSENKSDAGAAINPENKEDAGEATTPEKVEDTDNKEEVSDKIVLEASVINDIESKLSTHEDSIKTLEEKLQNATTQMDMNQTSGEIAVAWSDFLDSLLNIIEENAEAEAWKKFEQEQSEWAESRETAVREAGLEYEGGSMQALEENSTAARLTKERVYEIIDGLK